MLVALLWLLGLVVLVLLVLLLTPVQLSLRAQSEPRPRLRIGAAPLGGLVSPIPVYDSARGKRPKAETKPRRRREEVRRRRAGEGLPAGAAQAFARLLAELFARVSFDHLRIEADYGLGDPADTGQLFGWLAAISPVLGPRPGVSVDLRPDFERAVLSGALDAAVRVTPAALVPSGLRFALALWWAGR